MAVMVAMLVWLCVAFPPIMLLIIPMMALFIHPMVKLYKRAMDPSPFLLVDQQGVHCREWPIQTIPWSEVTAVNIKHVKNNTFLGLNVKQPDRYKLPQTRLSRLNSRFERWSGFGDIHVSLNHLTVDAHTLSSNAQRYHQLSTHTSGNVTTKQHDNEEIRAAQAYFAALPQQHQATRKERSKGFLASLRNTSEMAFCGGLSIGVGVFVLDVTNLYTLKIMDNPILGMLFFAFCPVFLNILTTVAGYPLYRWLTTTEQ
ncbi:hypothetical protein LJ739_13260 [Aestuariibacter halophilus]|uniref:Uncharacterized protein n=2 Tax=Fluctibacter halophilus TaxID=226011 RepID=A0ABS8GAK9_9ALTE|nr:hypothetical protein [Aestuariibacter halophilus]